MNCKTCIGGQCTYKTMCIDGTNLIVKGEDKNGVLFVENPVTQISSIIYPDLKESQDYDI